MLIRTQVGGEAAQEAQSETKTKGGGLRKATSQPPQTANTHGQGPGPQEANKSQNLDLQGWINIL